MKKLKNKSFKIILVIISLLIGGFAVYWLNFSQAGNLPVVYILPHQDDELFMAGSIREHVLSKREVHVVMVTDGSKSKAFNLVNKKLDSEKRKNITIENFIEARNSEFKYSMAKLGVKSKNIHIANKDIGENYKDGEMTKEKATEVINYYFNNLGDGSYKTLSAGVGLPYSNYLHSDHKAIFLALRDYPKISDKRFYNDKPYKGFTQKVTLKDNIARSKKYALENYKVWKPFLKKYSIGGISVPKSFNFWQNHKYEYLVKPKNAAKVK